MLIDRLLNLLILFTVIALPACQSATAIVTSPNPTTTSFPTETSASQSNATDTEIPIPTVIPAIPASTVELEGTEVPPGFSLIKFADLYRPTAFAFDERGRMFVTSQDGNIYSLQEEDQDSRAESRTTFATDYYFPLGVAVHNPSGEIYVSYQGAITILSDTNGDGL